MTATATAAATAATIVAASAAPSAEEVRPNSSGSVGKAEAAAINKAIDAMVAAGKFIRVQKASTTAVVATVAATTAAAVPPEAQSKWEAFWGVPQGEAAKTIGASQGTKSWFSRLVGMSKPHPATVAMPSTVDKVPAWSGHLTQQANQAIDYVMKTDKVMNKWQKAYKDIPRDNRA